MSAPENETSVEFYATLAHPWGPGGPARERVRVRVSPDGIRLWNDLDNTFTRARMLTPAQERRVRQIARAKAVRA